ncbi:MAG: gamma-glutamyltransferase, partial [Sphaerochaetaceae bacterium]|nr:gamma-glutamyltransferase [Sphaerochaetaceae bacterium]
MKKTLRLYMALLAILICILTASGCSKSSTAAQQETISEVAEVASPVPEEKEKETFEFEGDTFKTGAVGRNGAAACASPIAAKVATDIMAKGGNAVDAAVGMIYAVGLLEPAATGIGGAGQMVIYLASEDRYVNIEYMTQAPKAAVTGALDTSTSENPPSVEALAIPGVVYGTLTALEEYGTMTAAE